MGYRISFNMYRAMKHPHDDYFSILIFVNLVEIALNELDFIPSSDAAHKAYT